MSLKLCWPNPIPCQRGQEMYLYLCWPKPVPWQRDQKMYLNLCWPNASHASEDTKCFLTWVDQTPHKKASTRNVSQLMLTKRIPCKRGHKMFRNLCWPNIPCQLGHKMHLHMCWPNPSYESEDKNVSQLELTKPVPCQGEQKMHLNLCWPNTSQASEDKKCVDQTPSIPARTQNVTQLVLT